MEAVLKQAVGFRITSRYGTHLEVPLRPFGERRWAKETGVISKAGEWGNLPAGEIYTTPDELNVNGILVLPVLESTITPHQGVDEFIRLTIRNGLMVAIDGGKSADILRRTLANASRRDLKDHQDPWRPYRIAEIAFGANSKARSTVADPAQPYHYPGVSIVEAEKRLGTMHIAFGDAKHGEEGAEGFFESASHYDFVIPRTSPTVEMFTSERDFKYKRRGEKIINDGGINFL
jgi:leucyl aminopeptidase (aminopeptidase T)